MDDLVERNDLYYKKFTNVPFNGEISGIESGKFKNGKKNGVWEWYYENGQLSTKVNYKDGEPEGFWESYHENGQLEYKGNVKDAKQDGLWEFFNKDGSLKKTETWKNGERINCEGDC